MGLTPGGERLFVTALLRFWADRVGATHLTVYQSPSEDALVLSFAITSTDGGTLYSAVRVQGWALAWFSSTELIDLISDRLDAEYTKSVEILDGQQ